MVARVVRTPATELMQRSIAIYRWVRRVCPVARHHPGRHHVRVGRLPGWIAILIDEVLTPDSSRFWPATAGRKGHPPSFDNNSSANWLETTSWDRQPAPEGAC